MSIYDKAIQTPRVQSALATFRTTIATASDKQLTHLAVHYYLLRLLMFVVTLAMMVDIAAHWLR